MKRVSILSFIALAGLLVTLVACGTDTPTRESDLVYTHIWETVAAARTETLQAVSPTPSLTNTPEPTTTPQLTNTPLLTFTPQPGTPSATTYTIPTQGGSSGQSCDNAVGVLDVTIPDGTEVAAGSTFLKTWRVKNLGPCEWNEDYVIIFGWGGTGTTWNTTPAVHFTENVLPGETIDLTVELTAPTTAGNYAAAFRLQNDKGFNFGPEQTILIVVK